MKKYFFVFAMLFVLFLNGCWLPINNDVNNSSKNEESAISYQQESKLYFDFSQFLKNAKSIEFDLYNRENVIFDETSSKFNEIKNRLTSLELIKSAPINGAEYDRIIITCSDDTFIEFDGYRIINYTIVNNEKNILYKQDFYHNTEEYRKLIADFTT